MTKTSVLALAFGLACITPGIAGANLLLNGDLDVTYQQEIVPNFFLPKPANWINDGTRSSTGAYEDEMSSESWAGPAPTPVTTNGVNADDWGVFFKPFSGTSTNLATGHLYQDVAATAGTVYTMTGWAGGEANALMQDAVFAMEFHDAAGGLLSQVSLSLLPTLVTANGQPFQYKLYSLTGTAPTGTNFVRVRASMINAQSNPLGGGQAFVVDDFTLDAVPEPGTMALLGLAGLAALKRRKK